MSPKTQYRPYNKEEKSKTVDDMKRRVDQGYREVLTLLLKLGSPTQRTLPAYVIIMIFHTDHITIWTYSYNYSDCSVPVANWAYMYLTIGNNAIFVALLVTAWAIISLVSVDLIL